MSAQGDDWTESLIREILPEASQEQIEAVLAVLANAATDMRTVAGWPSRLHLFRPGEYMVDGRPWEEYVCALMVPVKGPVDLWRQVIRREHTR